MRQITEVHHVIEMRRKITHEEWQCWMRPVAGMFRPAELLVYQGRLIEAIEEAQRIQIENYGDMIDVEFRCVTTSKTVTILHCPKDAKTWAV